METKNNSIIIFLKPTETVFSAWVTFADGSGFGAEGRDASFDDLVARLRVSPDLHWRAIRFLGVGVDPEEQTGVGASLEICKMEAQQAIMQMLFEDIDP